MKARFLVVLFLLAVSFSPHVTMAQMQTPSQRDEQLDINSFATMQNAWYIAGRVKTLQGDPVRNATVTVAPINAGDMRYIFTDPQGDFQTEYQTKTVGVAEFDVVLTIKKKGIRTEHTFINYARVDKPYRMIIRVNDQEEDPAQLSSADLVSNLIPKLKALGTPEGFPVKSVKDYNKAITDFEDPHHPERGIASLTKIVKKNPSCIACQTLLGVMELGWNDWNDAQDNLVDSVNATVADRSKGRPEALVAFGTMLNWQHQYEKSEPLFLEALKFTPHDALTLQELGRTALIEQRFEPATDFLKWAMDAGAGPDARLLYAEALAGAGQPDQAVAEMNKYLNGRDIKKMPVYVRQAWAVVQSREKIQATYAKPKLSKGRERVDYLEHPPADLIQGLEPAKDQTQLGSILDGVGAKVVEMLTNFPNTSSMEAIQQAKLGRKGEASETLSQKFRYLCMVPHEAWGPGFLEYRADFAGNPAMPKGLSDGYMLTQGFTSTVLFFHPTYRSESTVHYLGRQKVNGRDTYVLAFAQIPTKAHLSGNFRKGLTSVTTFSQGLAWCDATTYQIVRIHTELLAPLPDLRLDRESMDVNFNEVHFSRMKDNVWLPEAVTVTLDWNGKQLRNRHEYSDFRVFDVDATERIAQPKVAGELDKGVLAAPAAQ